MCKPSEPEVDETESIRTESFSLFALNELYELTRDKSICQWKLNRLADRLRSVHQYQPTRQLSKDEVIALETLEFYAKTQHFRCNKLCKTTENAYQKDKQTVLWLLAILSLITVYSSIYYTADLQYPWWAEQVLSGGSWLLALIGALGYAVWCVFSRDDTEEVWSFEEKKVQEEEKSELNHYQRQQAVIDVLSETSALQHRRSEMNNQQYAMIFFLFFLYHMYFIVRVCSASHNKHLEPERQNLYCFSLLLLCSSFSLLMVALDFSSESE